MDRGWPSFTAPLEESNIVLKTDRTLWSINSAALRFIPAARLSAEGYGKYAVK